MRFDLWPKMWSVLENVPCVLKKKVYSSAFGWNVLKIPSVFIFASVISVRSGPVSTEVCDAWVKFSRRQESCRSVARQSPCLLSTLRGRGFRLEGGNWAWVSPVVPAHHRKRISYAPSACKRLSLCAIMLMYLALLVIKHKSLGFFLSLFLKGGCFLLCGKYLAQPGDKFTSFREPELVSRRDVCRSRSEQADVGPG